MCAGMTGAQQSVVCRNGWSPAVCHVCRNG